MVPDGMMSKLRARADVVVALLFLYTVWGTTYYGLHIALQTFPPFRLASMRFAFAGAILLPILRARGVPWPTPRQWIHSVWIGVLLLVISNGGITFAQKSVSSSLAAIVVSSMPLWATLFAALFGTKPSRRELLGLAIGFAGVILLNAGGEIYVSGIVAVALLLAPITWAFGSMWSKKLSLPEGSMAPGAQMVVASVVLMIISVLSGEQWPSSVNATAIGALAYLTILGSLLALITYAHLLRTSRPAIATSYAYVNPLIAVLIGVGIGGEKVAPLTIAGGVIILAGVVIVLTAAARRLAAAPTAHSLQR